MSVQLKDSKPNEKISKNKMFATLPTDAKQKQEKVSSRPQLTFFISEPLVKKSKCKIKLN